MRPTSWSPARPRASTTSWRGRNRREKMSQRRDTLRIQLEAGAAKVASAAPPAKDYNLDRYTELVATLSISAAEAARTYDVYLITGDGLAEWDLVHFPQIAAAGAAKLTA